MASFQLNPHHIDYISSAIAESITNHIRAEVRAKVREYVDNLTAEEVKRVSIKSIDHYRNLHRGLDEFLVTAEVRK